MEAAAVLITGGPQDAGSGGGTANAQTASLPAAPTLVPGFTVKFTAAVSNSGPATFNLNGLGAVAIRRQGDLAVGDIVAGGAYWLYYDGALWNLVPSGGTPLPAGFLEMRSIFLQTSPMRQLSPVTPEIYNSSG